jgi:hypothetical protein
VQKLFSVIWLSTRDFSLHPYGNNLRLVRRASLCEQTWIPFAISDDAVWNSFNVVTVVDGGALLFCQRRKYCCQPCLNDADKEDFPELHHIGTIEHMTNRAFVVVD